MAGYSYKDVEARGAKVARTSGEHGGRVEVTLPAPSALEVSFHKEGIGSTIAKWFRSEPQTGDAAFDAAIYIDARTDKDVLKKLLVDDALRTAIGEAVAWGGIVEVDGTSIVWEQGNGDPPEEMVARLATFALDA